MSQQDLLIFVTGVVGRAMGSGSFTSPSAIQELTQEALAAFQEHIAPKLSQQPPAHSPSPGASQGPQKANWQAGAQAVSGGGNGVAPETKSFTLWGGDKAYLRENRDVLWADWLGTAQSGDVAARAALEKATKESIGTDPKWHRANTMRIARAKACLEMLQGQQQ